MKKTNLKKLTFQKKGIVELNADQAKNVVGGNDINALVQFTSVYTSEFCKKV